MAFWEFSIPDLDQAISELLDCDASWQLQRSVIGFELEKHEWRQCCHPELANSLWYHETGHEVGPTLEGKQSDLCGQSEEFILAPDSSLGTAGYNREVLVTLVLNTITI